MAAVTQHRVSFGDRPVDAVPHLATACAGLSDVFLKFANKCAPPWCATRREEQAARSTVGRRARLGAP